MRRLKLWCLFFAIIMVFTGCGLNDGINNPIISPTPRPSSSAGVMSSTPQPATSTSQPLNIVVEDDSQPPHEGMVHSRLTNEWVDANVADTRPIAVMIPNEKGAVPHYSISKASILYEANVEYRMTRLMAIYEDWQSLEKIGNIRSLRPYYAYWAFEWDAFIVHYGGPFFINELIAQSTTQNIDGSLNSDSGAFFRSTDRSTPHNAYTTGAGLATVIRQKSYSLSYRSLTDDNHFRFTSKASPNTLNQYDTAAKNATYIDMSGCYPLTRCYFEYNEEDGLYYRFQHLSGDTDGPHVDALTGEQLTFKNILVQYTLSEELGEGYLAYQCHDDTRDGWFFTNGKGIHVTWQKVGDDYSTTRYYDDYGNEIVLNTGKTMICIVQDGDTFTFR